MTEELEMEKLFAGGDENSLERLFSASRLKQDEHLLDGKDCEESRTSCSEPQSDEGVFWPLVQRRNRKPIWVAFFFS